VLSLGVRDASSGCTGFGVGVKGFNCTPKFSLTLHYIMMMLICRFAFNCGSAESIESEYVSVCGY
jgi:hypothetical protein